MSRLQRLQATVKVKLGYVALLRFLVFSAFLFFLLYFSSDLKKAYYSIVNIALVALFYYLILLAGKLQKYADNLKHSLFSLQNEMERVQRKADSVYKDPEFPATKFHYMEDLDLTGSQGLIKLINVTFSREGERDFTSHILQTKKSSVAEIKNRQQLIQSIAGKKQFVYKYLRLTDGHERRSLLTLENLKWSEIEFFKKRKILKLSYKFLFIATVIALVAHILTSIPYSTPFIMAQLLVFVYYRKAAAHQLVVFKKADRMQKVSEALEYIARSGFVSPLLANISKDEAVQIRRAYAQLAGINRKMPHMLSPSVYLFLNIFFLWDLWIIHALEKWYQRYAEKNREWLTILEKFDSLMPFVMVKWRNPAYIFPEITSEPVVEAQELNHPLLDRGVSNPLTAIAAGSIAIITGSNMAGKTTYLRSVGINLLLGLCGAPVACSKMKMCGNINILSSIRNQDSMQEGVSFFYAEVRRLAHILETVKDSTMVHIVLLDEVLKGTNSRERFIASAAVMKYLEKTSSITFITTHDIELANRFLQTKAGFYHFSEEIAEGKMSFDYKIKKGIVASSNALKILQMEGLQLDFEDN